MRYAGLDFYYDCASDNLGVDQDTLVLHLVDPLSAIVCLRAAGGPVEGSHADDTVQRLDRLMRHLFHVRPVLNGQNERVAVAAIRGFADRRGFDIKLTHPQLMTLARCAADDSLAADDVKRALRKALTLNGKAPVTLPDDLTGTTICLSYAVASQSIRNRTTTRTILAGLRAELEAAGAEVIAPTEAEAVRRERTQAPRTQADADTDSRTYVSSLKRVADCHLLIVLSDPGSVLERDWATRLGIPFVDIHLESTVWPHQTAMDAFAQFDADHDNPATTVAETMASVMDNTWRIRDQVELTNAFNLANERPVAYLSAAWRALTPSGREAVARSMHTPRHHVDALLHSGASLELATDSQRRLLETLTNVPRAQRSGHEGRLDDSQRALLAEAAHESGAVGSELLAIVDDVERHLARSRQRPRRFDLVQARAHAGEAVARRRRERGDGEEAE